MKHKMISVLLIICTMIYSFFALAEEITDPNDLSWFGLYVVDTKGRGDLVFQSSPRGTFMPEHRFSDGDLIVTNINDETDGYILAYDKGEFGYVDATYIDMEADTSCYEQFSFGYHIVETKDKGDLIFQEAPKGKFMMDHTFHDGDIIYANDEWRKDGYALAYDQGIYGYVDADYIDWDNNLNAILLEEGIIYNGYDLDHDGTDDTIVISKEYTNQGMILELYVNDNLSGEINLIRGGQAYLIIPSRDNLFLVTVHRQYSANVLMIWKYDEGSWICAQSDGDCLTNCVMDYASYAYTLNDTLYTVASAGKGFRKYFLAPYGISFLVEYMIEQGSVKLKSRYCEPIDGTSYIANRDFTTAKSETSNVNDGPVVKKGQKVTLNRMYMLLGDEEDYDEAVFEITVDGETAWINENSIYMDRKGALLYYY